MAAVMRSEGRSVKSFGAALSLPAATISPRHRPGSPTAGEFQPELAEDLGCPNARFEDADPKPVNLFRTLRRLTEVACSHGASIQVEEIMSKAVLRTPFRTRSSFGLSRPSGRAGRHADLRADA